jgi:hypothetical protein
MHSMNTASQMLPTRCVVSLQATSGVDATTPASEPLPARSRVLTAMAHVVYVGAAVVSDDFKAELAQQQQQVTAAYTANDSNSNATQALAVELLHLFDPYLCTVGSSSTATAPAALLQYEDTTSMLLWHTKSSSISKQGPVLYTLIRLSLQLLKRHCGAASSSTNSSKLVLENVHRLKVLVICLLQPLAQVTRDVLRQPPLSSQYVHLFYLASM